MNNTTIKDTVKMNEEVKKFIDKFEKQYVLTPQRIEFFNDELPKFAEKVFAKDFDIEKEAQRFVEMYRDEKDLGGYNSTYGYLYNWFRDYAAVLLGFLDSYDYLCSNKSRKF